MKKTLLLLSILLPFLFGSAVMGGDPLKGDPFGDHELEAIAEKARVLAEQGDVAAQGDLGSMYLDGTGVPQNFKEAFKWLTLASEKGHAYSQFRLGEMYSSGEGVPQDHKLAIKLYTQAADEKCIFACTELGIKYAKGEGVPRNDKVAIKWLTPAAEQGNHYAQYHLGEIYFQGAGVPQDYKSAVKWLSLAAKQADADAQYSLGMMYANGWGVPQDNVRAHVLWNAAGVRIKFFSHAVEGAHAKRDEISERMSADDLAKAQRLYLKCRRNNYRGC